MRSTFKVLFYVNASKEKNGIVPIMGRVTINGSVAQFSCKRTIAKELWDVKGNRAKGKSKEARELNLALDNIKAQIIKHYQRLSDREAYVTAEMVRNAYQGIGTEYETLLGAFDKDNATFKKRVGTDWLFTKMASSVNGVKTAYDTCTIHLVGRMWFRLIFIWTRKRLISTLRLYPS